MMNITNEDNMQLMARYPDNFFDLAIVDPPYGLDFAKYNRVSTRPNGDKYISNNYKKGDWDKSVPDEEYFKELFRVSKNQIVWGGNYFPFIWNYGGKGFIYWHKGNPVPNFADGELAWTSFNKVAKQFDFKYYGGIEGNTSAGKKFHPTQKPVKLYEWLLINYAQRKCNHKHSEQEREFCTDCRNKDVKILDTHLGSGSIAIACHRLGFDLTACELDKDYFEAAMKRIKLETAQKSLF
jgi:site-specific DNA-methyltransferase (adenine-specific)